MVGQRLKILRREKKIRQEDLATAIGVRKSTVSNYETDKDNPSDNIKVKIALFFNVSLDYLLGIVNDPIPFYNPEIFILLPNMNNDEKMLLADFIAFIKYRQAKHK